MSRFAEAVLRHRRLIGALWILLFLTGGAIAGGLADRLTVDYSLPGQPGYETERQVVDTYGQSARDPLVAVVTVPDGQTVEDARDEVGAVFAAVRSQVPEVRVVDYASTGDRRFLTDNERSTFGLIYVPPPESLGPGLEQQVRPALQAAAAEHGVTSGLTGYQLLSQGESSDSDAPSVLTETLLGGLGALAVLAFVFASLLALVPLIIATVSILTTFLIVFGLTTLTDVSFVVEYLIALVGLGVAIDYSLLLVNRWREERDHGADNHSAVVTSMRTAGRAVIASGGTVAISLLALIVIPVPLLRSMGIGGLLIPLVSVAVVLTLLPVLLSTIGPRVDWPHIRKEAVVARGWSAWARMIVRFRWAATGAALALLALLIAPVFGIAIGQANSASLARSGSTYEALQTLQNGGVGNGVLTPMVVLVHGDGQAAAAAAADVEGVRTAVVGPARDGLTVVDVIPDAETVDSTSNEVVNRLHDEVSSTPGFVGVAGDGATVTDYDKAVYRNFPYILAVIAAITYVLLVRTFRSLLLPLKAVLLNLISLAAVFGATVFFWQNGNGSDQIYNVSATSAITFWLPPLIFGFMFGLSMDYEVFILARMREEYDRTGSTYHAIVTGLGRTGRLVTSAALILFFAFLALSASPGTDVKVFATALGVGILIDATLVRALLVPALVSVFGRWNWWLPRWPARLLRVQPSPLAPHPARLTQLGPGPEREPTKAGLPREKG